MEQEIRRGRTVQSIWNFLYSSERLYTFCMYLCRQQTCESARDELTRVELQTDQNKKRNGHKGIIRLFGKDSR